MHVLTLASQDVQPPPSLDGRPSNTDAAISGSPEVRIKVEAPAHVSWTSSYDLAAKVSQFNKQAFAVYFADGKTCAVTGEPASVIAEYKIRSGGVMPEPTVFDDPVMRAWFAHSIVKLLVKIPLTEEQREKFKEWKPEANTLVVLLPDGKIMKRFSPTECRPATIVDYLKDGGLSALEKWHASQKDAVQNPAK